MLSAVFNLTNCYAKPGLSTLAKTLMPLREPKTPVIFILFIFFGCVGDGDLRRKQRFPRAFARSPPCRTARPSCSIERFLQATNT